MSPANLHGLRTGVLKWRVQYGIALERGGCCVRDNITGHTVTRPATSEEAQQAVAEWNARCVTRQVDPPLKVDGWLPAGELRVWLLAEDGWWGLGAGRTGGAVDARRGSQAVLTEPWPAAQGLG